jgi:outer membrane protein assembly factor BamB
MHNLKRQPLQEDMAATKAQIEQSNVAPLEEKETKSTAKKAQPGHVWRYLIPAGILLLAFAVIFAGVLASGQQTQRQKTNHQRPSAASAPVSSPLSLPAPTARPLQSSTASSHDVSINVVNGVAYVGTLDNAVYALRMSDGRAIWQSQIDGSVGQMPLVLNGVVYVTSFTGQNGPGHIYALRASDGTVLWHFNSSSYVYLSPSGDGNTLYVAAQEGVTALQANNGALLWHVATSNPGSDNPTVDNGIVYVTTSSSGGSSILSALRATDGRLLWQHKADSYLSISTLAHGVLYLTSKGALLALEASNGHLLWQRAIDADIMQPLQLINGVIYLTGTKILLPPAALNPNPSQELAAFHPLPKSTARMTPAGPALPAKEGRSTLYALRASDATVLWQYPLLNGANSWASWFAVENDVVYASAFATTNGANDSGEIYALHSQDGSLIWHDRVQASPNSAALVNGVIYLNANSSSQVNAVYAIRADNGHELWSYPLNGSAYTTPILVGTILCVGATNGTVYGLQAAKGKLLWYYQTKVGM